MTSMKALCLFLALGLLPVEADEIKLVGTPYCPLICEGEDQGFMVDIARAILEEQGHTLNYKHYPRSRSLDLASKGEVDGLIGQIAGFDVEYVYPAEQTAVIKLCFYTAKSSTWEYESVDSLMQVKLGLIPDYGYSAVPEIKRHIEQYDTDSRRIGYVIGDQPLVRILKMVSLGRFSATVDDVNIVNQLIEINKLTNIRMAGCAETRIDSYIIFPRVNANAIELAAEFDEGMAKLRASGELDRILAKYAAVDWK